MFVLSKLFWLLVDPGNVVLFVLILSMILLYTPWRRAGRRILTATTLILIVLAVLPVGKFMLEPLENRFPTDPPLPERVDGIVVLGGALNPFITASRGQPALNGGAERMTEFMQLAQHYPRAKLVFSGGSGSVLYPEMKESVVAKMFFERMGFGNGRVLYETESRNTHENALFTRELVKLPPGETWILVTSAAHMPRSVGCFRRAGWTVVPFPVDYETGGQSELEVQFNALSGLGTIHKALREWIGLVAYRLLDRTDTLFPGPA